MLAHLLSKSRTAPLAGSAQMILVLIKTKQKYEKI
jgi:hypothetical protein